MEKRYERNIPAISEEEQAGLASKKVLVLGCGGLGGYILEYLARLGIGHITAVDGDVFETGNLNRQLYSTPDLIGHGKAAAAARRIKTIAPDTDILPVEAFFCEENADRLVRNQHLVIDALDNLPSRLLMEDVCERQKVIFIHGAILGWNMQVTVGRPGSRVLHRIYGTEAASPCADAVSKTSLSMTPAACAAMQAAEAAKILTGHESSLDGRLLLFNLETMEQMIIPVDQAASV